MGREAKELRGSLSNANKDMLLDEWWERSRVLKTHKEYLFMLQMCVTRDMGGITSKDPHVD